MISSREPGVVDDPFDNPTPNSARQSERLTLLSRLSIFVSGVLDSVSFLFFCLSFSSLTHLLNSWWNHFQSEE
jgi:hypothetical protein